MQVNKNTLAENLLELTITVSSSELKPILEKTAASLSQKTSIPGFRPGHAPYDVMVSRLGEMTILQEAAPEIINSFFWQAVEQEKIQPASQPEISVEKLAPSNDFVFKAKVALMPIVTLGDWSKIEIKNHKPQIESAKVDKVIDDLRQHQVTEVLVNRAAKNNDRVEIDFAISLNKVVVEGGSATKYPVVLGRGQLLPDFEKEIVGLEVNQEKDFVLEFPSDYHGAMLAGKKADVHLKLLAVYERTLPEIDDAWASKLGAKNVADLRERIEHSLLHEAEHAENHRFENELLKAATSVCQFTQIPESLQKEEAKRMVNELAQAVEDQGLKFADYLQQLKKTQSDLESEFTKPAIERIKTSLLLKKLAEEEKIEPTAEQVEQAWKDEIKGLQENDKFDYLTSQEYKNYIRAVLRNRSTIDWLKSKVKIINPID